MHMALWILQALLTLVFGAVGVMHVLAPIATLSTMLPWVRDASPVLVRVIGIVECLGAFGLVAPTLSGVAPRTSALAAAGFLVLMVVASLFHAIRGEVGQLPGNIVLALVAGCVAVGRLRTPLRPDSGPPPRSEKRLH